MYRHIKIYEIRYTDVDAYDNLKLSSLLSFMEQSACLSADELGFGYNDVSKRNIGFILANCYIELYRPVKLGDISLEVHTWPLPASRIVFLRDYELYVGGEKVGVCATRWCMVDTTSFAVLPVSVYFGEGAFDDYNRERSTDFKNWKIPSVTEGATAFSETVKYSDYDHYFHMNNTKYADYLSDVFCTDELNGKYFKKAQITYVKQCKEGEKVDYFRQDCDGYTLVEGRVDGEARVSFKVELDEIRL